ncbi:MAG: glycoside hydrolase family 108 protein [Rhodoferax sp.]|nr:glycoside hydrolase family 108 protein [Rhodoferax sp.]
MERNFPEALAHTLQFEGGWANNPNDPGGATMMGITQRTYNSYLGRDSSQDELRHISDAEVAAIYRKLYWDACRCDELPDGLDLAVFDTAVNTGPTQAARLLQRTVGVPADGRIGPKTIVAVNDYVAAHGLHALIEAYTDARQRFYRLLPTYVHFGEGWRKRADGMAKLAKELGLSNQTA